MSFHISKAHAMASAQAPVALLLIDVINDFAFPEARKLLRYAFPAARKIATLKSRLAAEGVPVIYVNDNFGRWRSDFEKQVEHCLEANAAGRAITELLLLILRIISFLSPSIRASIRQLWMC